MRVETEVTSLSDQQLQREPTLTPRHTPPSAFAPLVERLRGAERDDGSVVVEQDDGLADALGDCRGQFQEQVVNDFGFNQQRLWEWATELDAKHDTLRDAYITAGFKQLTASRRFFLDNDQWSTSRIEQACWDAFHQFYCDALAIGDRLLKYETGRRCRRAPEDRLRRHERPGAASYCTGQALVNIVEQGLPNVFYLRRVRGLLPILVYQGVRTLLPRPPWRSLEYLDKAHHMLTAGTLRSYAAGMRKVVERTDVAPMLDDSYFFDPATRLTRHNIIIALSHRHSFFDLALMADVFRHIKIASWSNIQYFPKSAATDPFIVTVNPGKTRRLDRALARTADLVIQQRLPITSYVDGGAPYLPYGQQMRIKPGIRLMVDYLAEKSKGTPRKTYVVPVSYDDTCSFIRGQDPQIRLTIHRPSK